MSDTDANWQVTNSWSQINVSIDADVLHVDK